MSPQFEIKSKPIAIRVSQGKTSEHWQMTIPAELRQRFDLTHENAKSKRFVFIIKSNGKVEIECIDKDE
jgi:bifunctional DNA-binding transcriptional regulator/antitoxin component of YhaV-PrlF toxin-antitoxin module